MINKLTSLAKNSFNYKEFEIKILILLISFSFLFFYPIIYGSGFYADDVSRVHASSGGFVWHYAGRFFATDVAQIYSNNRNLIIDAAPLTWIISIILIGISSKLIYCKLNTNYKKFALPLSIVFIVNPFLLENLLYRFDNLGMFLALFFTVLSFSLNFTRFNFIIRTAFILISLNFYQTFSNLFIALVAIELVLMAINNVKTKDMAIYFSGSMGVFILANIAYYIELKLTGVPSRGEFISLDINLFKNILYNYTNGFNYFIRFWSYFKEYIYFLLPLIVFSLIISKANLKTYITIILSSILISVSTLGAMALIKDPYLPPRGLHYFSPIMMLITLILIMGHNKLKWFITIPIFICFVFSYRVGNMQKIQSNFEKPIIYNLVVDLLKDKDIKTYYSIGNIPYSNNIKNIINNTPFNGFLTRDRWITTGILNEYAPKGLIAFEWDPEANKTRHKFNNEKSSMVLSIDNSPFYKIYKKDNEGWIIWP